MTFDKLYRKRFSCWEELEREIEQLETAKARGDAFEQFAFAYFTCFRDIYQIRELFMGPDIPDAYRKQYRLEKKDSGVDGLFIREDSSSVAYQVKFRSAQEAPSYEDLTSFWAESEHAAERCIFANCYTLPRQSDKKRNQFTILRGALAELDSAFFDWLHRYANTGDSSVQRERFTPLPHQQKMIREVLDGFSRVSRGKLLAACGTGKTLAALWIGEALDCRTVLYVAPSLALIKQTLEAWMPQAQAPFCYLCVCSDETVAREEEEEPDADLSHIGVPVTTEPEKIRDFLRFRTERKKVIFSTYQSLDAIVLALSECAEFSFDFAVFDEAHRTAGNKDSVLFLYGMNDRFIPCRKRLFMTATERFVHPRIAGRAKQLNYEIFSMDDPEQYGPTFTSLPFREAIEQGIISDYKIVLCCMKESELKRIVQNNQIVSLVEHRTDLQTLFRQVLLGKAICDLGIRKVISYHRGIEPARQFISPTDGASLPEVIAGLSDGLERTDIYAAHVNGTMTAGRRREIFSEFAKAPCGVLSNAHCLTEGIDVPIIDAVYFADPKNSMIDIIQAVGRSLRKNSEASEKISHIILPVVIADQVTKFEDIDPKDFATLHTVVQALRDQDRILADRIDRLNLRAAKGKEKNAAEPDCPILIELSEELDLGSFSESLGLRIAEVNKDPGKIAKEFLVTRPSRTSGIRRTFRTVGDYMVDTYYRNLVLPTLERYKNLSLGLPREAITLDHNNVSHCVKIGALEERDRRFYVTDVGRAMYEYRSLYRDIFREQMLKYYELDAVTRLPKFPYRMALRVIAALGWITRFEFVCSLYIGRHAGAQGEEEAVERVRYLRDTYPNVEILSTSNKKVVLDALNARFDTTLTYEDIWSSRTTVYNQFRYIQNHLQTWDGIFDPATERDVLALLPGGADRIRDELAKSAEIETCQPDSLHRLYTQYQAY